MTEQRTIERVLLASSMYGRARQRGATELAAAGEGWTENEQAALALANALLDLDSYIEARRRQRQWAALERLLAAIPPGGSYEEVQFLPREQALVALRDANTLGWVGTPRHD